MAIDLIDKHARARAGVISTQVLQEFFSAATRKLGIPALEAKQHVRDFRQFDVVQVTLSMIEDGIDCSILNQISFWDGLVICATAIAGCSEMLSGNLSDGQTILGVIISNPFD